MQKKIRAAVAHPLISGSFFIITGGVLANFFNFLFNLSMSRNLNVSDYGVLLSLISIIGLFAFPAGAAVPTIVSIAGEFFSSKKSSSIKTFYFKISKPFIYAGIFLLILSILFNSEISKFLNITSTYLIPLTAFIIFLAYLSAVNFGFFQARLSFKLISATNILASLVKVLLGFGLVMLGFGINGAIFSVLISFAIPIFIGLYILRNELFTKTTQKISFSFRNLATFGIPSAIVVFCLTSYISVDIILVKHLFSAQRAGLYAGLSLIGRVIFYFAAPITTVMFPLITNKFNRKENYYPILFLSFIMVFGLSVAVSIFYFLYPKFTILFFLKKEEYLQVASQLGYFGIFITLYSLVFVLSYYFLSIKKTGIYLVLLIGVIIQILMIYLFHANFFQIININIGTLSVILVVLSSYFFFISNQQKNLKPA